MPGTSWFWTAVAILVVAAVCLIPSPAKAYEYQDDFSSGNAEGDSYFHSIFWPQGAYPPEQAYLYFHDNGDERKLGFRDNNDDPAYICYRFPEGSENLEDSVYGELLIDVTRLESSGYLFYELSSDGVNWSEQWELPLGSQQETHQIQLESVRGSCYVKFSGTAVLIDNLEVSLYTPSATILVPDDYATIQDAIDNASDGDIIEVGPGTYSDEGNRDIDFLGMAITVRSSDGPYETKIDCSDSEGYRGFYFRRNEGPDSVLRGFTIKGATMSGSNDIGGGILCDVSSPSIIDCIITECAAENGGGIGIDRRGSPTIIDCLIEDCRAGGFGQLGVGGRGGGIALFRNSDATILHTQIRNNSSYNNSYGAGVYCWQSSALFSNCDISRNTAQGIVHGGGAFCGGPSSSIEFKNCVISKNTAETGGGLCIGTSGDSYDESVIITNCTIAHNSLSGDQISTGGGVHSTSSDITILNSIVWYNDGLSIVLVDPVSINPVLYSCVEGGYSGQGNIENDPLFASSSGNDYHLKSFIGRYQWNNWVLDNTTENEYSPCIDAGDPQDPVGAEPVTNGKYINMGAYGGTVEASKSQYGFILHVDKYGSNSNSGMSSSDAFATIQYAVDMACDGDTILVWPGTYREDVKFNGRAITLQSADEAAVVKASSAYAFSFYMDENSNCVVRNFIITGCNSTGGGAIFLDNRSSPKLTNLTITDNIYGIRANAAGGADPDIVNCILWNNTNGDLYHCYASHSCIQDSEAAGGIGNITTDPCFADSDSGDYHLKSKNGRYSPNDGSWLIDTISSPCIDNGNPRDDPGREQRPHGGRINMGAYGGTPFASLSRP